MSEQLSLPHVEITRHDDRDTARDLIGKLIDKADSIAPEPVLKAGDAIKNFDPSRLQGPFFCKIHDTGRPGVRRYTAVCLDEGLRELLGEYLASYGQTAKEAHKHLHYAYDQALHRRKLVVDKLQRQLIAARAKFPLSIS